MHFLGGYRKKALRGGGGSPSRPEFDQESRCREAGSESQPHPSHRLIFSGSEFARRNPA
jgi:hypothetical protein